MSKKSSGKIDEKLYGDDFWGRSFNYRPVSYKTVTVETAHKFVGNKFNIDMVERQNIDANEQKSLGVEAANLKVNADTHIKGIVTFEGADYENTLGAFTVSKNGTIKSIDIMVPDATNNVGATFELDTPKDAKSVGFFIVADGFKNNNGYAGIDLDHGKLEFITNYGKTNASLTKVTDDGNKVSLVHTDDAGHKTVIQGPVWFTTERGGSNSLNGDGVVHSASGIDGNDKETLKIAFEDLPKSDGGYDADYNDTVFTVQMDDVKQVCVPVCVPVGCKDIIDYCDPVTTAITNFVNVANNVVSNISNNNYGDGVNIAKASAAISAIVNVSVDDSAAVPNHHA